MHVHVVFCCFVGNSMQMHFQFLESDIYFLGIVLVDDCVNVPDIIPYMSIMIFSSSVNGIMSRSVG